MGQEPEELLAIKDRIMRKRYNEEAAPVRMTVFNSHLGETKPSPAPSIFDFIADLKKFYGL